MRQLFSSLIPSRRKRRRSPSPQQLRLARLCPPAPEPWEIRTLSPQRRLRIPLPAGASRTRPYAPRPRVPDYVDFCEVAVRHEADWEITYHPGADHPYEARHRIHHDLVVTCADLTVFDTALDQARAPAPALSAGEVAGRTAAALNHRAHR
ncbi:hypothetical protein HNR23_000708 [Nocardiopsis mwathae]|uniref:Uncharacterized protein n=1 Tax=Nocardiopsis mwathae TaxID=1472723 RepID=A0A7W9YED9_9ACTN|nr:hypothetical protein [Nocardiopsis mwathae]MBB6170648.1 hypothetical protein [Nocardiopsis mwathae]